MTLLLLNDCLNRLLIRFNILITSKNPEICLRDVRLNLLSACKELIMLTGSIGKCLLTIRNFCGKGANLLLG